MHISWFESRDVATGRLGLSHSPGVAAASRDDDLAFLAQAGVQHIVCLQEAHEFEAMRPAETVEARRAAIERLGLRFSHSPIVDFAAPSLGQAADLVALLGSEFAAERHVVMHCWAGLGRAGTIAACLMVAQGMTAEQAIDRVRAVRSGAIQSMAQEDFIAAFAARKEFQK